MFNHDAPGKDRLMIKDSVCVCVLKRILLYKFIESVCKNNGHNPAIDYFDNAYNLPLKPSAFSCFIFIDAQTK